MRLRAFAACIFLALIAGCGANDSAAAPSATPAPAVTPSAGSTTDIGGREAVNPEAQFVSYRRDETVPTVTRKAMIAGTLRNLDGCLVLEPGQVLAFNADLTSFDGETLTLEPLNTGDPVVRVELGEEVSFGGGYDAFSKVRASPTVSVPRACAAVASAEVAFVESW